MNDIQTIINKQREFFYTGTTLDVQYRIKALKTLKQSILNHQDEIEQALKKDLGKSPFESYMCEIGLTLSEITYMLKHIKKYTKNKMVYTPLSQFHAKSYQIPSPYGVVLIMSPWNYPFLLTLEPLIDALTAGNTAVLKPSAYSPETSEILKIIIQECFDEQYVSIITGGRKENTELLQSHFDYIFFTGSKSVGKLVMEHASHYLTPVTLELGGKSPCIVSSSCDLKIAARRIVFGKFLNCGQTCVAPDYILVESSIKDLLVEELKKEIILQYGRHPLKNETYGKIINDKHFDRILSYMNPTKVVHGGHFDTTSKKIEPTIMVDVQDDDLVMQEEIFGPVLPIVTYNDINEVIHYVNNHEHPLALYLFTHNEVEKERVMNEIGFGGGCINDTIIHLASSEMGFGGFGESGIGSYHGRAGFDTFTHYKSIVDKGTRIDLSMRYQPYKKRKERIIHFFLK